MKSKRIGLLRPDFSAYNLCEQSLNVPNQHVEKVNELMRVKQISVKNLFGIFNHSIPLNMEERITIIHGPNGFGKTALLKLIDALFNLRYPTLRSIPFDEFCVNYDNGDLLQINQILLEQVAPITFHLTKAGNEPLSFSPTLVGKSRNSEHTFELDILKSYFISSWIHEGPSEGPLETKNADRLQEVSQEPIWLEEIRKQFPVRFIQTQRLSSSEKLDRQKSSSSPTQLAVEKYAKELVRTINAKLAESAEISQSLDRTFPVRMVSGSPPTAFSTDELRKRLSDLEEKRKRLMATGLLDRDNGAAFQIPPQIDETKRSVLSVYINDVEKKLGVFDDMADRIEMFSNIINRRFLYKQMTIDREKGFLFTTSDDKPLASSALSSGEQHEIVLLFELLFKVKPGSLVLIDEPELSLHVAWQQQFLNDLQEIARLSSIDVMIATHSPDIISDRWDLTVELKGPPR